MNPPLIVPEKSMNLKDEGATSFLEKNNEVKPTNIQ